MLCKVCNVFKVVQDEEQNYRIILLCTYIMELNKHILYDVKDFKDIMDFKDFTRHYGR